MRATPRIRLTDIARSCKVSPASVARVIDGQSTSDRIQRVIAKAIGQPVEDVFPERTRRARRDRVVEQKLAG
jgi:lambda repressor-like predicted transcriptional regulator